MPWVRLECTHFRHPKVIEAGIHAELLDLRGLQYTSEMELDGRIPRAALSQLGDRIPRVQKQVDALITAGRWRSATPDDGFDGWIIHNYLKLNPSRADREADRAAAAKRQRDRRARTNGTVTA
jgi:hypothetical protein